MLWTVLQRPAQLESSRLLHPLHHQQQAQLHSPPTSHQLLARPLTVSREPLLEVGKGKPGRALVTGLKPAVHTTRSASSWLLLLLPPPAAAVLRLRVQRSGAPSLLAPDRLFTCGGVVVVRR